MLSDETKTKIEVTIKAVESIPCDICGEKLLFDSDANMISDPIKTPWPMPWITEEITKLVDGRKPVPSESVFKVYNPEEDDQYILLELKRY